MLTSRISKAVPSQSVSSQASLSPDGLDSKSKLRDFVCSVQNSKLDRFKCEPVPNLEFLSRTLEVLADDQQSRVSVVSEWSVANRLAVKNGILLSGLRTTSW